MKVQADQATRLVGWRTKLRHPEGDQWVTDDGPGEYTGPYGKTHLVNEGCEITWCGKEFRPESRFPAEAELARLCHICLAMLVRPFLPSPARPWPGGRRDLNAKSR